VERTDATRAATRPAPSKLSSARRFREKMIGKALALPSAIDPKVQFSTVSLHTAAWSVQVRRVALVRESVRVRVREKRAAGLAPSG